MIKTNKNSYLNFQLANNKRVQDKLRDEVNKHFDEDGKINFEALNELSYLDHVFYEALRLHSPAVMTTRVCTDEVELEHDGQKVFIEKDMNVIIPILQLHYDPEIFLEPTKFHPERFDDGGLKSFRDRGVLLPFGDGKAKIIFKINFKRVIFYFLF
jgi:cytochrome P450